MLTLSSFSLNYCNENTSDVPKDPVTKKRAKSCAKSLKIVYTRLGIETNECVPSMNVKILHGSICSTQNPGFLAESLLSKMQTKPFS